MYTYLWSIIKCRTYLCMWWICIVQFSLCICFYLFIAARVFCCWKVHHMVVFFIFHFAWKRKKSFDTVQCLVCMKGMRALNTNLTSKYAKIYMMLWFNNTKYPAILNMILIKYTSNREECDANATKYDNNMKDNNNTIRFMNVLKRYLLLFDGNNNNNNSVHRLEDKNVPSFCMLPVWYVGITVFT